MTLANEVENERNFHHEDVLPESAGIDEHLRKLMGILEELRRAGSVRIRCGFHPVLVVTQGDSRWSKAVLGVSCVV